MARNVREVAKRLVAGDYTSKAINKAASMICG